jgi:uncharacterized membrane protein YphA (DoxX/SURF4 family)
MSTIEKFEQFYITIKGNLWYWLFSIFCRLTLALGFIIAGFVKIMDERFAGGLSEIHPMGTYLVALYHTGYYYTFIGIAQVLAAILLLISRTVTVGALVYFPIILNICILSFAVRFEGSLVTAPLMVFANLYILVWNYDKLKYILPFKTLPNYLIIEKPQKYSYKFPYLFLFVVVLTIFSTIALTELTFDTMPRNSIGDCNDQFKGTKNEAVGADFCDCIHKKGKTLNESLEELEKLKK